MNIVKRVVITLSDKEQQTLKDAAQILRDCAATLDEYSGDNTGYRIENLAADGRLRPLLCNLLYHLWPI